MGKITEKGPMPKDSPLFSGGLQMFSHRRHSLAAEPSKLPDAPTRDQFASQDEFDEAQARWVETVGRIKAMASRSGK